MLSRKVRPTPSRPVRVLQIGAGNFSRAFTAFALQLLNEQKKIDAGIVIATSSPQKSHSLTDQDGLYTVVEASAGGVKSRIIDAVQDQFSIPDNFPRFLSTARNTEINLITSNTTEAGIIYEEEDISPCVHSFPARLTLWLKERHQALQGEEGEDLFIIPCELLENNGALLQSYVLRHARRWGLSSDFRDWLQKKVKFYNTLVDRIVPGYPYRYIEEFQRQWGYEDAFAVLSECFFFWALEGDTSALDAAYPFSTLPLDIVYTNDLEFYRLRKVSYLNGAHTVLLGLALLSNHETVQETLSQPQAVFFLKEYLNEVLAALKGDEGAQKYIEDVCNRFANPYVAHRWMDILLNASSKFAVRNMPIMLAQSNQGIIPKTGLKALAALLALYKKGIHQDTNYALFQKLPQASPKELAQAYLSCPSFCPFAVPIDQWAPLLAGYMDQLSCTPKDIFSHMNCQNH